MRAAVGRFLHAAPALRARVSGMRSMSSIKALTFDTGGTILDWHTGFSTALKAAGSMHGVEKDWAAVTNELRRRSMKKMVNLGEHEPPAYNFDGAHKTCLDEIIAENGLDAMTDGERRAIWYDAVHSFQWAARRSNHRCPDCAPSVGDACTSLRTGAGLTSRRRCPSCARSISWPLSQSFPTVSLSTPRERTASRGMR